MLQMLILTSFIQVDGDLENFVLTTGARLPITIKINLFRVSKSNQNVVSSSGISDAFQICLPVILWQCRVCLGRFLLGRVKSRILFLVIFDDIWSMNFLLLQAVLFVQQKIWHVSSICSHISRDEEPDNKLILVSPIRIIELFKVL